MIDDKVYGKVTPDQVAEILEEYKDSEVEEEEGAEV